jgi:hypothetical protein
MIRTAARAAAVSLCLLPLAAQAHWVAGARIFPTTLTLDDPAVPDEASLPTFTWQRSGADESGGPSEAYGAGFEVDKRITTRLGVGVNDAYTVIRRSGAKTVYGWRNVQVALKYLAYVNPEHEFMASLGVIRELGRTGAANVGADNQGATTPTIYFGKGLGDVPVSWLRPAAITGTVGYSFADRRTTVSNVLDPDAGMASQQFKGNPNLVLVGLPCCTACNTCSPRFAISGFLPLCHG